MKIVLRIEYRPKQTRLKVKQVGLLQMPQKIKITFFIEIHKHRYHWSSAVARGWINGSDQFLRHRRLSAREFELVHGLCTITLGA